MAEKLYWNTVTPLVRNALHLLMTAPVFNLFRLMGGTSLSLQLGHRFSDDIDLFTDAVYGSIDFDAIDVYLHTSFPYVTNTGLTDVGLGTSYFAGNDGQDCFKLDLYYTDTYVRPVHEIDNIRMADIEDVIAMKMDVIQRGGRKKDFWDVHELLDSYTPVQMIALHKERYPYSHDEDLLRENFSNFALADDDFEPVCNKGKYWELIKMDIVEAVNKTN